MPTEKYIKYNGSFTVVLSCDQAKRGKAIVKETVYEIADEAFIDCKNITEIELPNGLAYIGESAFDGCI